MYKSHSFRKIRTPPISSQAKEQMRGARLSGRPKTSSPSCSTFSKSTLRNKTDSAAQSSPSYCRSYRTCAAR